MMDQIPRRSGLGLAAVTAYGIALFWVNHIPLPSVNLGQGRDKVAHLIAYSLLSFLLAWTIYPERRGRLRSYLTLLAAAAIYGAVDELCQMMVPRRSAAWADWGADVLGALIGLTLHALFAATMGRCLRCIFSTPADKKDPGIADGRQS